MHNHSSSTHKIMRHILRRMAHRTKLPYELIKQSFSTTNPDEALAIQCDYFIQRSF